MRCLLPMKTNYYLEGMKQLESITLLKEKPSLLLHACCAPCAAYPLQLLKDYFEITVYFYNDNIYPALEYERRRDELKRYIDILNQEENCNIKLLITTYKPDTFLNKIKHLSDQPERGKRCHLCYQLRLEDCFKYASEHHFNYVSTVLTSSRQKDSQVINATAKELNLKYPEVFYFYSDFKKNDGILKANALIEAHTLYRQHYCGCVYSYNKSK